MSVDERIKREHREFEFLLDQPIQLGLESKGDLFPQALEKLDAHAKAEEAVIFPLLKKEPNTRDTGLELSEWHRVIRSLMRDIASLEDDGLWVPSMKVAKSMMIDHFRVEEGRSLFTPLLP